MLPLSTAELNLHRIGVEDGLDEEVAVLATGSVANGIGGRTAGTESTVETVAGRLGPLSGSERRMQERLAIPATGVITVPTTCVVTTAHRLRLVASGRTFEVLYVPSYGHQSGKRVQVREG